MHCSIDKLIGNLFRCSATQHGGDPPHLRLDAEPRAVIALGSCATSSNRTTGHAKYDRGDALTAQGGVGEYTALMR
jgi:hypothetical protein